MVKQNRGNMTKKAEINRNTLIEFLSLGLPKTKIAQYFNVHVITIRRYLKKFPVTDEEMKTVHRFKFSNKNKYEFFNDNSTKDTQQTVNVTLNKKTVSEMTDKEKRNYLIKNKEYLLKKIEEDIPDSLDTF